MHVDHFNYHKYLVNCFPTERSRYCECCNWVRSTRSLIDKVGREECEKVLAEVYSMLFVMNMKFASWKWMTG